jgi:hypothetical protein
VGHRGGRDAEFVHIGRLTDVTVRLVDDRGGDVVVHYDHGQMHVSRLSVDTARPSPPLPVEHGCRGAVLPVGWCIGARPSTHPATVATTIRHNDVIDDLRWS